MPHSEVPRDLANRTLRPGDVGVARVVLLGLPFDDNASHRRGAAGGPAAIREALHSDAGNLTAENGTDLGSGLLFDAGDAPRSGPAGEAIEDAVAAIVSDGRRPLCLGGDHSVTDPILRGIERTHERLSLLQFDAHPDLYDEFQGNRFSHACPMARILERGRVERLVQVGIRAMTAPQRAQAERYGVEVIEMRSWDPRRIPRFSGPVYVTLDLDAIDPAHAPGVAHREPGGLAARELIDTIARLEGTLVGADVVELDPGLDPSGITAALAAKLVKELAARILETNR